MRFFRKQIEEIKPLKKHKKSNKSLIIFGLASFFFLLACSIYGVWSFFNTYSLQSPILFQSPIVARQKTIEIISPVGSKSASMIIDLGQIADRIYTLESSGGKNDGCRKLGLFNGYGYQQNSNDWKCFTSHEEVRQQVIVWLEDHIAKYGLEKSLCIYNRGINETGCTYAINYQSL